MSAPAVKTSAEPQKTEAARVERDRAEARAPSEARAARWFFGFDGWSALGPIDDGYVLA